MTYIRLHSDKGLDSRQKPCYPYLLDEGAVAEWLGSGLQIPLCRFDSGPYLQFSGSLPRFLTTPPEQFNLI